MTTARGHNGKPPTIAFVMQAPFGRREIARYGVEKLRANGVGIKVVETGAVAMPDARFSPTDPGILGDVELHVFRDRSDIVRANSLLDDTSLVVCEVGTGNIDRATLPILRWISRSTSPILVPLIALLPTSDYRNQRPPLLFRMRSTGLVRAVLNRLPLRLLGLRPADYVVFTGSRTQNRMRLVGASTEVLWSQAPDQDQVDDELAARPHVTMTDTAVFIDQNFGFHPGAFVCGFHQAVSPDFFYPRLRRLFDRIEEQLGISVVVAVHPRADYRDKPDLFGPRRVIQGKIVRLIRESRLVIGSFSTAAGMAILFGKPLMVVTMPSVSALGYLYDPPGALANALGTKPIDLSDPDAIEIDERLFAVDEVAYRRYREHYIKSDWASGERLSDILLRLARAPASD